MAEHDSHMPKGWQLMSRLEDAASLCESLSQLQEFIYHAHLCLEGFQAMPNVKQNLCFMKKNLRRAGVLPKGNGGQSP